MMDEAKYKEMVEILNNFRVNGIRPSGKSLEVVLRFQDIIGMSTKDELITMWSKQIEEQMKRVFIWAVTSTCGFEMAESVIEYTLGIDVKKKMLKSLEEQTVELHDARSAFEAEKRQAQIVQQKWNQVLAILGQNN